MRHEPRDVLGDMLKFAEDVLAALRGKTKVDLESEYVLQMAVIHLLELFGEAASRMDSSFREEHPGFGWRSAVGMRNRLIHGYDTVDLGTVWEVVASQMPEIVVSLRAILDSLEP